MGLKGKHYVLVTVLCAVQVAIIIAFATYGIVLFDNFAALGLLEIVPPCLATAAVWRFDEENIEAPVLCPCLKRKNRKKLWRFVPMATYQFLRLYCGWCIVSIIGNIIVLLFRTGSIPEILTKNKAFESVFGKDDVAAWNAIVLIAFSGVEMVAQAIGFGYVAFAIRPRTEKETIR
ncbi:hypothetical protein HK102_013416, partial [Quaeritorhiza haematococci]